MAITFDPIEKIIQLDTYTVSERQLWTAFVDWAVEGDNLKYGVGMTQIGGVAPIPLYIYLALGWRVRPKEANGTTTITGNLLTDEGDYPIVPTLGSFNAFINLETPVKAVLTEGGGGGGSDFTAIEKAALLGNTSMIPFVAFTPSNSDILGN